MFLKTHKIFNLTKYINLILKFYNLNIKIII